MDHRVIEGRCLNKTMWPNKQLAQVGSILVRITPERRHQLRFRVDLPRGPLGPTNSFARRIVSVPSYGRVVSAVRLVGNAVRCISATYPEAHFVGPVAHCAAVSWAAAALRSNI
jgi:hypothetical protein